MFALAILGSFVLYLIIGAVVGRSVKTTDDYYVSGRNAPTFLVAGTLVASFVSTVSFMGELGFSYDGYAVPMLILASINISGYAVGVLLFGRYLRRSEALTVPEYFGQRFNSKKIQAIAGIMVVIGIGLYLVSVSHGLALIIGQLIDIPEWVIIIIVWVAYTSFTLLSGSKGILINDTIMFVVFTVAAVVGMGFVIGGAGGPIAATEKMTQFMQKPDGISWHGLTGENSYMGSPGEVLIYAITLGIVWALVVAVSPWQSSRFLMAKNEHVAIRSGMFATGALIVLYLFLTLGGFAINLINPNIEPSEVAFIWIAQNHLPGIIGILIVTGIVAAGLSSAASFLSIVGFSAANDILPAFSKRPEFASATAAQVESGGLAKKGRDQSLATANIDVDLARDADKIKLRTSRNVMLLVSVAVLILTFVMPPVIMTIAYFAATLFAASWGPVAIWSTQSRRITARGAIFGMIAGFVVSAGLQTINEFTPYTLPTLADPVILGLIACILGIYIGNFRNQPSKEEVAYFEKLQITPAHERDPKRIRQTGYMAWGVAIICFLVFVALVFFYAIPYGQIVG
ncbi:MAG: sodium:solute symporter family protein [Gulosibacter sp.]|uniref:sodium:solute symporter family protein n=1 Tax=Gulosibacter sp. TaxID=2817531 RepID=UPI003F91382B